MLGVLEAEEARKRERERERGNKTERTRDRESLWGDIQAAHRASAIALQQHARKVGSRRSAKARAHAVLLAGAEGLAKPTASGTTEAWSGCLLATSYLWIDSEVC